MICEFSKISKLCFWLGLEFGTPLALTVEIRADFRHTGGTDWISGEEPCFDGLFWTIVGQTS